MLFNAPIPKPFRRLGFFFPRQLGRGFATFCLTGDWLAQFERNFVDCRRGALYGAASQPLP